MIAGGNDAANLEVKCVDLTANPYLLLAALLVAGAAGSGTGATLPDPVDVDPAALPPEVSAERRIERLPTSLAEATDALAADGVFRDQLGPALIDTVVGIRRSEIELFADATPTEIVEAIRWRH